MKEVISHYLSLLDAQREAAFTALDGITDIQLWQRPALKEWSFGEILNHNYLLFASICPAVHMLWNLSGGDARLRRNRPYQTEIEDLYRSPKFPHQVGFLWTPRYGTRKPVSLEALRSEIEAIHTKVRRLYEHKPEDLLGNLYLYDPVFGWCNLIVTLRIGIYHDQLHYDDIFRQVKQFKS